MYVWTINTVYDILPTTRLRRLHIYYYWFCGLGCRLGLAKADEGAGCRPLAEVGLIPTPLLPLLALPSLYEVCGGGGCCWYVGVGWLSVLAKDGNANGGGVFLPTRGAVWPKIELGDGDEARLIGAVPGGEPDTGPPLLLNILVSLIAPDGEGTWLVLCVV